MKQMNKKHTKRNAVILAVLVFLIVIPTLFIGVFAVLTSFMSTAEMNEYYGMIRNGLGIGKYAEIHLIPDKVSFEQYISTLWESSDFWFYFWNSVLYSLPAMFVSCIIAVLGGYAFAKFNFPLRRFWLMVYIVIMMIPYQVIIPPNTLVLEKLGLLDTRAALIIPNFFTAFGTYLLYQFISYIPDEIIEQARVDGANEIRILCRIIIPNAMSGIISFFILYFVDLWNMIEQPLTYLKDEFKYPLSAALEYFESSGVGTGSVCSIIFTLPAVLAFIIWKDYLILGIKNTIVTGAGKNRG